MVDICKNFGEVYANKNIDFEIEQGKICAIVGENGAGKTTLMNMLYGVFEPTSGDIYIKGKRFDSLHQKRPFHLDWYGASAFSACARVYRCRKHFFRPRAYQWHVNHQ